MGEAGGEVLQSQPFDAAQVLAQQLDRIAELLVNLDTGVPPRQPLQVELPVFAPPGGLAGCKRPGQFPAATTGAADVELVPVLGIEIEHE